MTVFGIKTAAALAIPYIAAIALCAPARAQHTLAGTWIAIDDGFPRFVAAGLLLPTEEILHVDEDGRAESRLLTITGLDTHYMCMTGWGCSDMLAVRAAQAEMQGGNLVFRNRAQTVDAGKISKEPQLQAAGLTLIAASPQWVVSFEAGGRRARFETGSATRIFAKIEPEMLNRLRAAPAALEISYATHWRCFLSNATASDPAFDLLGGPRRSPGAWFAAFLPAAYAYHRLVLLTVAPTPDDDLAKSDPDWAKSATMSVSNSMLGASMPWPKTVKEKTKYRAPLVAMTVMAKLGDETVAKQAARQIDPAFAGIDGVTPAGLRALQKVVRGQETVDPEVRDLFCLDRKDVPPVRPDYDPFRSVDMK